MTFQNHDNYLIQFNGQCKKHFKTSNFLTGVFFFLTSKHLKRELHQILDDEILNNVKWILEPNYVVAN